MSQETKSYAPGSSLEWDLPTSGTFVIKVNGTQVALVSAAGVTAALVGGLTGTPAPNATQSTLTGTSAGSAISSQPINGASYKVFLVELAGYENTTVTAQTITFPTAFSVSPLLASQPTSFGATVSATTLTLPVSMASPVTGWIFIVGY